MAAFSSRQDTLPSRVFAVSNLISPFMPLFLCNNMMMMRKPLADRRQGAALPQAGLAAWRG